MAEYIEKSFAIEAIKSLYPGMPRIDFCGRLRKWHEDNENFMRCEMAIEVIPAADVAPVKHGKWTSGIGENGVTTSLFCSACHYENGHWYEWYYCPHCGAKMDGGKNV